MLFHAITTGARFRRVNPLMIASSEFKATVVNDGYIVCGGGSLLPTTSNTADDAFDTQLSDTFPLNPNQTPVTYLTSSIDTTVYLQFNWYEAIRVTSIALIGYNGLPTTIEIYGSNSFDFSTQSLLHTQTLDGASSVSNTFTDWYDFNTVSPYKFLRVYFLLPWVFRTGTTTGGGIGEVKLKIADADIANAGLYYTHTGYAGPISALYTSQSGTTPANAFNYLLTSAWRTTYAAINAAGGCWLQLNTNSDTTRMNLRGFAIQQGQTSQYYGQGAPGYYSLKCSNTGAFTGEETTIIDNQLFDYGAMSKTNLCISPWVEFAAPGLHRYYRWYFYSWTNLDHGFAVVPGIGKFYLKYSRTLA